MVARVSGRPISPDRGKRQLSADSLQFRAGFTATYVNNPYLSEPESPRWACSRLWPPDPRFPDGLNDMRSHTSFQISILIFFFFFFELDQKQNSCWLLPCHLGYEATRKHEENQGAIQTIQLSRFCDLEAIDPYRGRSHTYRTKQRETAIMPLWIFESETLIAMLADARHVLGGISKDTYPLAREMIDNILAELHTRGQNQFKG